MLQKSAGRLIIKSLLPKLTKPYYETFGGESGGELNGELKGPGTRDYSSNFTGIYWKFDVSSKP